LRAGAFAAAVLAAAAMLFPDGAARLREAATDVLMAAVPRPEEAPAPVVVVAVDAAATAESAWPWSRNRLARLVAATVEAGAAAVAFDIATPEQAPGDAELSAALARVPAVQATLAGTATPPGFGIAVLGAPDLSGLTRMPGLQAPAVTGAAAAFGGLPGETVRSAPMLVQAAGSLVPGLALGALARGLGAEAIVVRGGRPPTVGIGPIALPMPGDGLLRLHPARSRVPVVPAATVLAGEMPEGALRGRLAVIGVTAPAAAALRASVLGGFVPSAIIQAEVAAQLAAGWVPMRPPGGAAGEALLAILLGAGVAAAVRRRSGAGLMLAGGLAMAWVGAAALALRAGPILLDPVLPAAGAVLGGATEAAAAALRLAQERARLVARFAQRLPTGVAEQLLALPAEERLRPERREVTVVLTDLAGFSAVVNRAEPAQFVAALNAYLAGIEAAILAGGGTLERLIGDSVLGVFGAPLPQPDHAARALAAAREVDRFAEAFRRRPDAAALGWGETRIGVASGPVLAGELGGSRLTWSVCGDAANIAARLQELGKSVGCRALVSGIEDASLPPPIGRFALRGLPGEREVRPLN